ncbi:MAG: hypothetical protein P4L85_15400 [Paludisphaera borealis]|uniref:hypothetical protein n=1 Tax=Paludisphaera borealis TaxID=1387353 RepID=UPI002846695B|nr:hypothetical protein [Paludisphaera borealis]MDR3620737.1 hypothetical protein [Paludisphaera borealis]
MPTDRVNDLPAFKAFLDEKLSNGGANLTVDEALALWEIENQTDQEREETLEAIRRGFADLEAGRTRPFEEFDREIREKLGLPPRS